MKNIADLIDFLGFLYKDLFPERIKTTPSRGPQYLRTLPLPTSPIDVELDKLCDFVEMVANGSMRSLISLGAPGMGKSTSIMRELDRVRHIHYKLVKGATTPKALYRSLFDNQIRGRILILDDCDDCLRNKNSQNILKAALDSSAGQRTVSWQTEAGSRGDLPQSFQFEGALIFVSNLDRSEFPRALQSRSFVCDIQAKRPDVIKHLWCIVERDGELVRAHKDALQYELSVNNHYYADMNVRTLEKMKTLLAAHPNKWRELARNSI